MANEEWGPLAALIGDWEGTVGLDVAFSHERNEVFETPFSEKVTMKPFGPVQNGSQTLFGLDYKTAMWRGSEENPFHTEVGYWLWDAATGEVLRCFVVPAGHRTGRRRHHDRGRRPRSRCTRVSADTPYRIAENTYLAANASTVRYESNITINADGSLELRRGHDAAHGRDRRRVRPHRPQHPGAGRLNAPGVSARRTW